MTIITIGRPTPEREAGAPVNDTPEETSDAD
jgi:hypothetical protein